MTDQAAAGRSPNARPRPALDSALERALGFLPNDAARVELYRWVDAFGVHPNDALVPLLAFLEKARWDLDRYPGRLEEVLDRYPRRFEEAVGQVVSDAKRAAVAEAKVAIASELKAVPASVNQALTDAIAAASKTVAARQAQTPTIVLGLWAAAIAAVLGGLFMVCGWELARGKLPFWMSLRAAEGSGFARVCGAILGAPAGYWALLCAGAAIVWTLKARWSRMKSTVMTSAEKRWQWAVFAALVVGWLGFLICMIALVGSPVR